MYSRIALALVCALAGVAVGAAGGPLADPDSGAAQAQFLPTATRFVPRTSGPLVQPTTVPTVALPPLPLVPSPTSVVPLSPLPEPTVATTPLPEPPPPPPAAPPPSADSE